MVKNDIGFYLVNNVPYVDKLSAVLAAQQTNSNITWNFFKEEFEKVDWTIEPNLSLDELYRIRAQQIRDNYDYIIVFCSGGADSNNVIRTFINNSIHVDEVIGLAPVSGLKNWKFDPNNHSESNTISEIEFALFPLLKEIKTKSPNTTITVNDYFEDIQSYKNDDWTFDSCGNIVTVLTSHFTDIKKFSHIDKLIEQGKKVALVYGTDKPVLRIGPDKQIYFVFADAGINYLNMPKARERSNVDRVLFYWSPSLPEMLIKQAHIVARTIHLPENRFILDSLTGTATQRLVGNISLEQRIDYQVKNNLNVISKDAVLNHYLQPDVMFKNDDAWTQKSIYQRMIVPYIYPSTYTKDLYQCQKVNADAGFFTTDQSWVHKLHKGTRISDLVISGIKTLHNAISPRYLNMNGTGFLNYFNSYTIGHVNNFDKSFLIK